MRTFELVLDGFVNQSLILDDGTIKAQVLDIVPGQNMICMVASIEELGHKSIDDYVTWITEKAGYVEVQNADR